MNLSILTKNAVKTLKSNSPEILTALSISGVFATSYLTAKATFKASNKISEIESIAGTHGDKKERIKERTRLVWKCYIPAGISGALTVTAIIASSKANSKRTTAAVTAYSLTERAFSEYKEKVVEQIGQGKEQKLRDELAQERVLKNPSSKEVLVVGAGQVLCYEQFTGRYFRSDMEKLRKVQNDINVKIVSDPYVTLDEFYERIGLPYTSVSNKMGWDSNKLLEVQFSTVLSENGEPCLAFEYNYIIPIK